MTEPGRIERLVLRAPNWLGDAVLALPAMAAFRVHFAASHLTIAAPASVAPLYREATPASPDRVLELPHDDAGAVAALRGGRFNACVLFPNSFRSAWQSRRAAIPDRWGYQSSARGWLLTRKVRRPATREPVHHAEYYGELSRRLGVPCQPGVAPSMGASEPSVRRAEALLRQYGWAVTGRLVAILPGAAYGQAKQWAPDRLAELASRLVLEHGARCLVLGATHDRAASRAIESWLRARAPEAAAGVLDLVGHTSLGALAGLLSLASLCISNDSGGMHVAAALGRPVVAIFGPTDERVTRPLGDHDVIVESVFCRPCMLRDCPIDHRCMKRITVDRVLAAAAARLATVRTS